MSLEAPLSENEFYVERVELVELADDALPRAAREFLERRRMS